MGHDRRVSRLRYRFLGVAALALLAISVVAAQRPGDRSTSGTAQAGAALNAVPNLGPNESFKGVPWTGQPGVTVTVAELMAREANAPRVEGAPRERRHEQSEREFDKWRKNPDAPAVSQWPADDGRAVASASSKVAFNITNNWLGPTVSESGFIPPDSNGAVGPTQVLVTANGRFKVYDKLGNLGSFNVSDQTFWSSVITVSPGGTFVSDPHVRYDRLSGRWFISEIDVPEPCECSNRILIAVSSGSTITDSTSFTLYQFQHDLVGPTPNPDTGGFADYDTLGVDQNALYIGANIFDGSPTFNFRNVTGYVVNKASLLSGGPPVVTAFRQLLNPTTFAGPYTPQGVDNDDPAATEGYFIGVDGQFYGRLAVRRVTSPGATPSISGSLFVTTPGTGNPIPQAAQGSVRPLDALDIRLYAAMIKKNKLTGMSSLWTAHNIAVFADGAAPADPNTTEGDRNAGRWYQLDNLTTTPTLTQSGTIFDAAASGANGFWINTIAANGQGHAAIGQSWAGPSIPASMAVFSRQSNDPLGQMSNGQGLLGIAGYNIQQGGTAPQRWGDFSQVVVDPTDDMTLWTFQEYCNSANNVFFNGRGSWGVRVIKLQAPAPATPASASPASVPRLRATTKVIITGTSTNGSGFFDPGPGFANHISATVSGGVVVNAVRFIDPTHVELDVNTVGATEGPTNVTITNPDGQSVAAAGILTVSPRAGLQVGDFDGDGKSDLTVFRSSTGGWHVLKSSTNFTTSQSFSWGLSTDVPVPGDYDGDGKIDPAIFRPSTGLWAVLKSSTNYTTSFTVSWGLSTDTPVPGDFDGDGITDPTVYRSSTGGWLYLKSSTNYTSYGSVSWGLSTDLPQQGDFDGDGKSDPAIYRPSTGLWAVLKSSTSYTTSLTVSWGLSTDIAVPGDYDGDGRADPAIFRPSTGLWAVLKSSTNYTTSFGVSWGLSTDVPVPADYDGDGKFDPAIFRPSTGLWAGLRSSTNYTTSFVVSWGLSTDTPINKRP
jgi:hypothetical protein